MDLEQRTLERGQKELLPLDPSATDRHHALLLNAHRALLTVQMGISVNKTAGKSGKNVGYN